MWSSGNFGRGSGVSAFLSLRTGFPVGPEIATGCATWAAFRVRDQAAPGAAARAAPGLAEGGGDKIETSLGVLAKGCG